MPGEAQRTGMMGVYLVAAELTRIGWIVSPTSRSAAGADLLITDHFCRHAWSVQVKTQNRKKPFWNLNSQAAEMYSKSHMHVFVRLNGDMRPDYFVMDSTTIATSIETKWKKDEMLDHQKVIEGKERWDRFGTPNSTSAI